MKSVKQKPAPKQLYITLKAQDKLDVLLNQYVEGIPLGYASAYEPHTKAFSEKFDSQNKWSVGYDEFFLNQETNTIWIKTRKYVNKTWIYDQEERPEHLQPRIIDNIPEHGYKINSSVSRLSTSNKLWRIEHPKGFELEITTANMEDIIGSCTIIKGEIQEKCYWKTATILAPYIDNS